MARGGTSEQVRIWSLLRRSFAHRTEGDTAQQMLAQQNGEQDDRDDEESGGGRDRRPILAAFADDEGNERRHGLRVAAGEENGEGVFVPRENQTEDRGRGDPGHRLRQTP